ncbi:MAG TPA: uracil-DNA glycosylase [Bryobacteraceae bacterium]|nr:uracil-DNA glycosylase [Bryobacteraceae bacterium]
MKNPFDTRWPRSLVVLNKEWIDCHRCPRLVAWREEVAKTKRRAYRDEEYWGRPVPSFGDPAARLVIVGLAPGAHGANRTGRMFTGDRSGEFLYRALYENGFANQPQSASKDDGLMLTDAFITAPVRCVPPDNKPERQEVLNCRPMFQKELGLLEQTKVVVALGGFGWGEYLSYLQQIGKVKSRAAFSFGHNKLYRTYEGGPLLLGCYHPSQQNTSTGKLTAEMLRELFARARKLIEGIE